MSKIVSKDFLAAVNRLNIVVMAAMGSVFLPISVANALPQPIEPAYVMSSDADNASNAKSKSHRSRHHKKTDAIRVASDYITVEEMSSCRPTRFDRDSSLIFFDKKNRTLSGWSHIFSSPENFPDLELEPEAYRVDENSIVRDDQCKNLKVFKSVLTKKYANWDQQHANGIENTFEAESIAFGEIKDIVFEVKINSEQTTIPSQEEYLATYAAYTSEENLLEMDQNKVNFSITLFGKDWQDQAIETFSGAVTLEFDQALRADKWLRVVIPAEVFTYYLEQNYGRVQDNLDLSDFSDEIVYGLRINPETKNNRVLRNYISDIFDESVPELYKEQGVSIRGLAIRKHQDVALKVDSGSPKGGQVFFEKLAACEESSSPDNALVLFDNNNDRLSHREGDTIEGEYEPRSWSHIFANWDANADEFSNIFHSQKEDYSVMSDDSVGTDFRCDNYRIMDTVLVKKYADWDGQHMSGLEYRFPAEGMNFNDVKDIVLELKIDASSTVIPRLASVVDTYSTYVDEATLLAMDQGLVNFGITLFGENADDQSISTLHGALTLELDHKRLAERWIRIVIPADSLSYFTQLEWSNTDTTLSEQPVTRLVGFRINPETRNNRVLRNYISDSFDASVPEMYKEQGISLHKVLIRRTGAFE